jgi:hypothetical protein
LVGGGGIFYDNNNSYNRAEKCFYCIFLFLFLFYNLTYFCFVLLQIKRTSLGGVLWRRAATRMTSCNS